MHAFSPDDLRDTLIAVYARPVPEWAVKEIEVAQVKEFQAWIHREWAAVNRASQRRGTVEVLPPMSDREKDIYTFIRDEGPKTGKEIARHFGLDPKSVDRTLKALRAHGVKNRRG